MSLSASDVSESSVPERQCFRCAWVLSQVQWSRGEYSTFHPISVLWRPDVIAVYLKPDPAQISCLLSIPFLPHTEAHLGCNMFKMPSIQRVGHYNASQSIILLAERFNQLDIMASFMLCFKCHSSYSQAVVLAPKTVLKSEGQALFGPTLGAVAHSLTFSWGAWILDFSLNATHQTSMGGPVWDEICGFVVLPLNSLAGPWGFDCDW